MRKRKVTYPVARTATRQPRPGVGEVRSTVAAIDLNALEPRDDLRPGDRVRIGGNGLYAGQLAVVESIAPGVIPAADVRTDGGQRRRARSVDLQKIPVEGKQPA